MSVRCTIVGGNVNRDVGVGRQERWEGAAMSESADVVVKITACLEALGIRVPVPHGLTDRQQITFLLGALSASGDALVEHASLVDGTDDTDGFAQGYALVADRLQSSVVDGMIVRLHGYCDVMRLPGFDHVRRPVASAAYNAMAGASQILASFGGTLEETEQLLGPAIGHLLQACTDLDSVLGPSKRAEPAGEEVARWIDAEAARSLERIETYGFYTQYVGEDPESGAPPYAYTVGLSSQDAYGYEFAVSGLSPEASHGILWNLVRAFGPDGMVPADALEVPEILAGHNVRLRTASTAAQFDMIERLLAERSTVWQAVCPDDQGRFPGEAGYALEYDRQHLL
jgi:hypothetical protein